MAFKKYAHAIKTNKDVHFEKWMDEIRAQNEGVVSKNHINRVANVVLRKADPKQYLLSHATIVASVDTFSPKNIKTGRSNNRGIQIDVKYPDFRIKPNCHEIINNNSDSWERSLLLSTYRTFIGANNYCEHIQLPELSKGFIIDAISRDLGDTCYIDILVGTDRKHRKLIDDILSGEMNSLSMGCISLFTICSKCGNVAIDESQLCPCIQYDGKGSKFADEDGIQHPVAELIGHVSVPNSNQFIEASWVKNPAFRGAIRRNFLNKDVLELENKIGVAAVINKNIKDDVFKDVFKKAANVKIAQDPPETDLEDPPETDLEDPPETDLEDPPETDLEDPPDTDSKDLSSPPSTKSFSPPSGGGEEGEENTDTDDENSLDGMVEKAQNLLLENLVKSLESKLQPKPEDVKTVINHNWESSGGNDNIVRSSIDFSKKLNKKFSNKKLINWAESIYKIVHIGGAKSIKHNKLTPQDMIVFSWIEDSVNGRKHSANLYKTAMKIGSSSTYPSVKSFVTACGMRLGRSLTKEEQEFFSRKGKIASLAEF